MGRRLIILIVLALAAGYGVRIKLAQADAPVPPLPADALPVPEEVPPPSEAPAGAELPPPAMGDPGAAGESPPPATGPATPPGEGTPPSKEAGPPDGGMPPVPAKPDPSSSPGANPAQDPLDPAAPGPFPPVGPALPSEPPAPAAGLDHEIERSQAPPAASPKGASKGAGGDKNPLPAAMEPPGQSATIAPNEADELVLSPERLSKGAQSVSLSVEVKGPPTLNLNTPATYRLVVNNAGTADATSVAVYDRLPAELEFVSSQPAEQRGPDRLLVWHLGTVRAGGRQEIVVKVKPTKIGLFDHAATVTMRAGAKTTTQVYEPKLKVVQLTTNAKVLKGQTVESRITVTNTGNGVARNVIVRAKLTPGLRANTGTGEVSEQSVFELDMGDLAPGQHFELDPLVADAVLGGEQSCKVEALSPDVAPGAAESKSTQIVEVIEPKLAVTLVGPKERYTDTIAVYALTVQNTGTATARNVRVQTTLPVSGRLVELPTGARFNSSSRQLTWDPFELASGEKEKVKLTFEVRMGGIGPYKVSARAVAEQGLTATEMMETQVIAMADLDVEINEDRRVVDVGQLTTFTIKIKNNGSKAATEILIRGKHSDNVVVKKTAGTDEPATYKQDAGGKPVDGEFVFPLIARLDPDKTVELGVQVQALKPGLATCRVFLTHKDIDQSIDNMAAFRITQALGQ